MSSNVPGGSPEAAQFAVRQEMARHAAELEAAGKQPVEIEAILSPVKESEWFYLDKSNKPVGPVSTEVVQKYVDENGNCKVCEKGSSAWTDASQNGFTIPVVEEPTTVPIAKSVESLGDVTNPAEERLETYPDSDLEKAALTHGVIKTPAEFDRTKVVKALAAIGVVTL